MPLVIITSQRRKRANGASNSQCLTLSLWLNFLAFTDIKKTIIRFH